MLTLPPPSRPFLNPYLHAASPLLLKMPDIGAYIILFLVGIVVGLSNTANLPAGRTLRRFFVRLDRLCFHRVPRLPTKGCRSFGCIHRRCIFSFIVLRLFVLRLSAGLALVFAHFSLLVLS
jgi:hypothetical protein